MLAWFLFFLLASLHFSAASSADDTSINNEACFYRKLEMPGSVKILVIAGIRARSSNGSCGNYSRAILEQLVALEWIVSYLNGNISDVQPYISNVTIGYDIYDNCDSEEITTDLLYSGLMAGQQMDCRSPTNASTTYIGAISLTTPGATSIVSRVLYPLPVFRPIMSSPSLQSRDYPNLLQTVVSFQHEALALAEMLKRNGWNFIIVVRTEDMTSEAQQFMTLVQSYDICVNYTGSPSSETVNKIFIALNSAAYNKSIAVVYFGDQTGAAYVIRQSQDGRPYASSIHWVFASRLANRQALEDLLRESDTIVSLHSQLQDNVDFLNAFESLFNSSSSPLQELSSKFKYKIAEIYPEHMIDANLLLANAVREIWNDVCNGNEAVDKCVQFKKAVQNRMLKSVNVSLNVNEKFNNNYIPMDFRDKTIRMLEDGTQYYENLFFFWFSHTKPYERIGNFTGRGQYIPGTVTSSLPTSACNYFCQECQERIDLRYSYIHGEVLILGIFSLRNYGDSTFSCGRIKRDTNDIITVSSFLDSVQVRRNQTGIPFGAIAIDDCYNGFNTSHYLSELFSKRKVIKDPKTNTPINFDNVISIVGALSSTVTLIVADLSTSLSIPMISYSASSPDLDNRNRYPYFLRTVPSDTMQVQGMMDIVSELGVTHLGLIYINDAYGQGGKIRLLEEAEKRNICIESPISVSQDMDDNYVRNNVINMIYRQQVRVVLFFGIDTIAQQILKVMNLYFQEKYDRIVFIASEAWGTNQRLITTDIGQISKGAIVLNIATRSYESDSYHVYLSNLKATQQYPNRWIPRYFEDYNKCDNITSFEKSFPTVCGKGFKSSLDSDTADILYGDQRGVHTMLSVFAATEGYYKYCQSENNVCSAAIVKGKTKREAYFSYIKSSLYGGITRVFSEDGNGNIGFTVYNIQLKNSGSNRSIQYEQIGSYTKDGKLKLTSAPKFYNDVHAEKTLQEMYATEIDCLRYPTTCSHVCSPPVTTPPSTASPIVKTTTEAQVKDSGLMTMTIVFGVFMAVLMIALIFVVVILVRIQHRQGKQMSERGGSTTSMSDVHTVYDEPASIRRKEQFDNPVFMQDGISLHSRSRTPTSSHGMRIEDGILSFDTQQPVQYAHVRHRSNPDVRINHVRQVSNQELQSHAFYPLERPASALSAPSHIPHSKQSTPMLKRFLHIGGAKQKIHSPRTPRSAPHGGRQRNYSPKTPHSAPTGTRHPEVYRPFSETSPKFRYPSTTSDEESHYALPRLDSTEEIGSFRRMGVSDDSIHESFDLDSQYNENSKPYLCPQSSAGFEHTGVSQDETEHKITYITAKDLVNTNDEEEDYNEDVNEDSQSDLAITDQPTKSHKCSEDEIQYVDAVKVKGQGRIPSLISPTDEEVKVINFPMSDIEERTSLNTTPRNTNDSSTTIKASDLSSKFKPISESVEGQNLDGLNGVVNQNTPTNTGAIVPTTQTQPGAYPKNVLNNRSSISDVPDIIKHGLYEEDGVFII